LPREGAAVRASNAFANGDVTASAPSALKDGKYLLETEAGPMQVPAASVSAIAFGGEYAPTRPAARLRFVDGSVLHLAAFECRDRELSSRSEPSVNFTFRWSPSRKSSSIRTSLRHAKSASQEAATPR